MYCYLHKSIIPVRQNQNHERTSEKLSGIDLVIWIVMLWFYEQMQHTCRFPFCCCSVATICYDSQGIYYLPSFCFPRPIQEEGDGEEWGKDHSSFLSLSAHSSSTFIRQSKKVHNYISVRSSSHLGKLFNWGESHLHFLNKYVSCVFHHF